MLATTQAEATEKHHVEKAKLELQLTAVQLELRILGERLAAAC